MKAPSIHAAVAAAADSLQDYRRLQGVASALLLMRHGCTTHGAAAFSFPWSEMSARERIAVLRDITAAKKAGLG